MTDQEQQQQEQPQPELPMCRHEYVRIYQRRLKGLDRRLVATPAWLPVGFKMADFSHLSEGSYCFCSKCRTRLYPKRTTAEKAQARIALAASKQQLLLDADAAEIADVIDEPIEAEPVTTDIHVEELEVESVELADLDQGAVALPDDTATCALPEDE